MNAQIKVAIAEDHDLVREGLVALFKGHARIHLIFDVCNGKELWLRLQTVQPDVVLLDLEMPIMSGKEVFEKIKQKYPNIKIIIISATFFDSTILDYLQKGAASFLYKNCKFDKLVEAIETVHLHGVYFDKNISRILASEITKPKESTKVIEFSNLEINILTLVRDGLSSKEIGERLFLNNRTVEWHRSQMLKLTGTKNAPDLIAFATRSGYL